ncbi:MAG: Oligopeptide transport system permease protein OppB [Candidatus Carbobacillus altaicus]|uniref:Oligopeptide transport system permease protein OppB n=1 Tax=Candidatus Carbonibacillus altaicus TaxID=2163959 RepID=A0A2R6Y3W0_9BACL|nr:MAG: Oligopeptide transport system permease protein OppB [Candidatus Carbobacillus altaicus]
MMWRYILKRIGFIVIALFFVSLITFILIKSAPGNYIETERLITQNLTDVNVPPDVKEAWEKMYHLDKPEWQQFLIFLGNAVKFQFGPSFKYPTKTVENIIVETYPVSLTLAGLAMLLAIVIGIPLGILSAFYKDTLIDRIAIFLSMIGTSIPNYVMAVFLIYILALTLHLVPSIGWGQPVNYVLPVLSLAIGPIGSITRFMRSSLIETLNQEYIKVARAKGGGFIQVVIQHGVRNSLIPLMTVIGPQLAYLSVGTLFVENLFNIPGLGKFYSSAAVYRDYPMVMGTTLFFAGIVMFVNLLVDIVYGLLDPRIRKLDMNRS